MKSFFIPVILMITMTLGACTSPDSDNEERLQVANEMVQAWNNQEWERMYELFAEDGVLHSVMVEPITGREAIRARLSGLTQGIESIELQIQNMGVINDVVMLERVDDFVYKGTAVPLTFTA